MTRLSLSRRLNLSKQFNNSKRILLTIVILIDIALVVFSDLTAFTLRYDTDIAHAPEENFLAYMEIAAVIVALRLLCFYIFGLYRNIKSRTVFNIIVSATKADTISSIIIIVAAFYFRALAYPRTVILISWALTTAAVVLWRVLIQTLITIFWEEPVTNVIIVGTDKEARRFGLHTDKDASTKYRLLGFIQPPHEEEDFKDPQAVLGKLNDLDKIISEQQVNEIIITTASLSRKQIFQVFSSLTGRDIKLKLLPDIYEAVIGNVVIASEQGLNDSLAGILVSPLEVNENWYRGLKRILDLTVSLGLLAVSSPVMLIVAALIRLTSPGPAIFRQERIGINGRRFVMYKFRTMYEGAEEDTGPVWAVEGDKRITWLGKILRLTRLDELPQLINVIKNDMSLVGPRPERPFFVDKLIKQIPFFTERLTVKPGITGWAQVTCSYADSLEDNKEKLLNDIFYIKNMSLSLDVWVFFKTILTIIQEKGAH